MPNWVFSNASAERGRKRSIEVRTKVGNKYEKRKIKVKHKWEDPAIRRLRRLMRKIT